jgi:hypothetical protein
VFFTRASQVGAVQQNMPRSVAHLIITLLVGLPQKKYSRVQERFTSCVGYESS